MPNFCLSFENPSGIPYIQFRPHPLILLRLPATKPFWPHSGPLGAHRNNSPPLNPSGIHLKLFPALPYPFIHSPRETTLKPFRPLWNQLPHVDPKMECFNFSFNHKKANTSSFYFFEITRILPINLGKKHYIFIFFNFSIFFSCKKEFKILKRPAARLRSNRRASPIYTGG